MYLLDTNHCSRIIFGQSEVMQQLQAHSEAGVATSVIVRGELFYMAAKSDQTAANLRQIKAFLNTINLYPINQPISDLYGEMKGFGDNDLWIAATAIHYNLTVVSTDSDFQRIQQVETFSLESWV